MEIEKNMIEMIFLEYFKVINDNVWKDSMGGVIWSN